MNFEEDDDIILFLLVPDVTNLLNIPPKSRQQLVWIRPWLQRRSLKKCLSQYYIGTKTTRLL